MFSFDCVKHEVRCNVTAVIIGKYNPICRLISCVFLCNRLSYVSNIYRVQSIKSGNGLIILKRHKINPPNFTDLF